MHKLEIYPSEGIDIYKNWLHGTDTLGLAILIANQIEQLPNNVQNVLFPHFSTSPHLEKKIKTTIFESQRRIRKPFPKRMCKYFSHWKSDLNIQFPLNIPLNVPHVPLNVPLH